MSEKSPEHDDHDQGDLVDADEYSHDGETLSQQSWGSAFRSMSPPPRSPKLPSAAGSNSPRGAGETAPSSAPEVLFPRPRRHRAPPVPPAASPVPVAPPLHEAEEKEALPAAPPLHEADEGEEEEEESDEEEEEELDEEEEKEEEEEEKVKKAMKVKKVMKVKKEEAMKKAMNKAPEAAKGKK